MQLCSLHSPLKSRPPPSCCWLTRRTPLLFATRGIICSRTIGISVRQEIIIMYQREFDLQFQLNKNRCSKTGIIGNQKFVPFSFYYLEIFNAVKVKKGGENLLTIRFIFSTFSLYNQFVWNSKKINLCLNCWQNWNRISKTWSTQM